MFFKRRSAAAVALVSLLTLTGCGLNGGSTTSALTPDLNQRIVVDNFRAPVANWALESDAAYILSLSGCLETLTKFDQAQGKVTSSLATDWKQTSP